jgi:hypothetical protein
MLPEHDVSLKQRTDPKFRIGDVWEYRTRPGEERSRLTILRIDQSPELGIIVHIAVDRITLVNCHGGPEPDAIPHMPFARKALEASIRKKVASNRPLPAYENGYEEWKQGYDRQKAGIYIITVAAALDVAEVTYRHGIGCDADAKGGGER